MARRQLTLFPNQPERPEDISKSTPLAVTLDLFAKYLQREGKSEYTIKAFVGDLKLLEDDYLKGVRKLSDFLIGDVTTTILNEFLDWMEHARIDKNGHRVPCTRKTYARRVTSLKVYFKWLHQIGALGHDPAKALIQRSGPAPLSHALDNEQIQAGIHAARQAMKGEQIDARPELLFSLLLQTGIKKGEASRLTVADLDRTNPDAPAIIIRYKAKDVYKERRLTLEPGILPLLDRYMAQYMPQQFLFTCTARNLEYILTDIGKDAGIPFKLSFEVMRWTCALRDHLSGLDDEIIREKLGLSRPSWYETGQKLRQLAALQARPSLENPA